MQHKAGLEHDLLLVCKVGAYAPPKGMWAQQARRVLYVEHPNEGYDIRSLQQVAEDYANYDNLMWFGSSARILADDWLWKFWYAAQEPDVGAVAASGSYEQGISMLPRNPHLRTSALMINPLRLTALQFGPAYSRLEHYEFEHGLSSLYRRLALNGQRGVVVGANGKVYEESEWPESDTYRHGTQSNLLIADGQTDSYAAANPNEKEVLAKMAGWDP